MTTIKTYTDIQQSKKLADILPLESADMYWYLATKGNPIVGFNEDYNKYGDFELPCWSLAALLELIADKNCIWLGTDDVSAWRCVFNLGKGEHYETTEYASPINACYEMIIKLKELNLL